MAVRMWLSVRTDLLKVPDKVYGNILIQSERKLQRTELLRNTVHSEHSMTA